MRLKYYALTGFAAIGNSKYVRILVRTKDFTPQFTKPNLRYMQSDAWIPILSTREDVKRQIYLVKKRKLEEL